MHKMGRSPKAALQGFLLQYRRTPLPLRHSPCELLQGRQIRSKLDALFPSPAHVAQGRQAREATREQLQEKARLISKVTYLFAVGAPCYALYFGPKRNQQGNGFQQWLLKSGEVVQLMSGSIPEDQYGEDILTSCTHTME